MIIIKDGIPYETKETLVDVKALEAEKATLEKSIPTIKLKDKPDEETLELWNSFVKRRLDSIPDIQSKIKDIDTKLATISRLK